MKSKKETEKPEEAITPPRAEETALAEAPPQNMDDLFGDVADVPVGVTLPVVKIGKETANFEVGGRITESLVGNLLFMSSFRIYFKGKYKPDDPKLPECSSSNGIVPDGGTEPQANNCNPKTCKLNNYVEELEGYPCQDRTMVYFLEKGSIIPVLLNLAPTNKSKKAGTLGIWSAIASLVNMVTAEKLSKGLRVTGKERYQQVEVKLTLLPLAFKAGETHVLQVEGLKVVNDIDAVKLIAAKAAEAKRDYAGDMRDLVAESKVAGDDHFKDDKKDDDCPI